VIDKANSQCSLLVSPTITAAEVIQLVLDAKNIHNEQLLYTLISLPTGIHRESGLSLIKIKI